MNKMKKTLTLLLALLLMLMPLAACSGDDEEETDEDEQVEETEAPEEDEEDEPEETEAPIDTSDDGTLGGIPADTVIMEVEGESVYWDEFYYYLNNARYNIEYYETVEDWEAIFEDYTEEELTYNEYVVLYAVESALERRAVEVAFLEQDVELDEETYLTGKDYYLEGYGMTEEEFQEYLAGNYLTERTFDYIDRNMAMYYQLIDILYGENGSEAPEDEIEAFADSNGIVKAKHILIRTVDDDYEPLTDEEVAVAVAQVEELYSQLENLEGDELLETFDALMNEYSEDTGLLSYPDGYVYMEGTMVTEFEETALALGIGEVGEPVETDYGYHIILRLPIEAEDILYNSYYTMGYLTALERMDSIIEIFKDDLSYTETAELEGIVPSDVFAIVDAKEAAAAAAAEAEAEEEAAQAEDEEDDAEDVEEPVDEDVDDPEDE